VQPQTPTPPASDTAIATSGSHQLNPNTGCRHPSRSAIFVVLIEDLPVRRRPLLLVVLDHRVPSCPGT
jgi:hypothetical protein